MGLPLHGYDRPMCILTRNITHVIWEIAQTTPLF